MKKFFEKPIFDPKNPIWLEIYRYFVIFLTLLIILVGIILSFSLSRYVDFILSGTIYYETNFGQLLIYLIATFLTSSVFYIFGMLSLNLFYNIQEIRINTGKK
jgi:hypothetical protein